MKILKICSLGYNKIINSFYRRNSHLLDLGYDEHKCELLKFVPVHLNGFSTHMRALGYDCEESVFDLESLQQSWTKEKYNVDILPNEWRVEVLFKQIESFRPDIVYMQDIYSMHPSVRRRIKRLFPFIKKVVVYRGFPVFQDGMEDVDLVLTGALNLLSEYEKRGIPVRYLPHGFEAGVLDRMNDWISPFQNSESDFSFLGYSGHGGHGSHHKDRYQFLMQLMRDTSLKCWVADMDDSPDSELLWNAFADRCEGGLMGLELYQVLNGSKVVFNRHSSAFPGQVENMRLFEATGVGSCLLTDNGHNLSTLFEPDYEVVAYDSYEECLEKLKYLLEHDSVRKNIGKAAQKRTLAEHTWEHRCATIDSYFKELF